MNIDVGKIEILLENVNQEDTIRIKKIIDTLFLNDAFNIRNGWIKLSFDKDKNLGSIEKNAIVWRQNQLQIK